MGEADALFCSLFRSDVEASMLACDDAGLVPEELLYLPREVFFIGASTVEQGLIRYNMRERFRQEMFRKVFGIKRAVMLKGNDYLIHRWNTRRDVHPDAPGPPDLTRIPHRKSEKRQKAASGNATSGSNNNNNNNNSNNSEESGFRTEDEALDTESEDDGLDEYFRPKPPPSPPQEDIDEITALNLNSTNPLDISLALWANGTLKNSLTERRRRKLIAEPPPPPKAAIPHVPREPPRCRALSERHLQKETRHLELSRKRLAHYGTRVETAVTMTRERQEEQHHQPNHVGGGTAPGTPSASTARYQQSSPRHFGDALVVAHQQPSPTSIIPMQQLDEDSITPSRLPRIPLSHLETKRQLAAMVRGTMVKIAESAIGFNTFKDDIEDQREERQLIDTQRRNQSLQSAQGSRDAWASQESARRQKDAAAREAQQKLCDDYEAYRETKTIKTQAVLESKKQHHVLMNEVQRMRQMFANQKRDWMHRREDARVNNILSRSEPKHQHAESVVFERRFLAEQRKQQHVQMELLRKELKQNVAEMNTRNEWEVPKVLEHLASRSSTRQSVVSETPSGGGHHR